MYAAIIICNMLSLYITGFNGLLFSIIVTIIALCVVYSKK